MSRPVPFTYASLVAPLAEAIAARGGRAERAFDAAGLPIEVTTEPELVIPLRGYFALMQAGARELGDEHVGVTFAEGFPVEDLGPYGRLVAGALTLGQAIATAGALAPLYSPALQLWLVPDGDMVRLCYRVDSAGDQRDGVRFDAELALVQLRDIVRLALGPAWQPTGVILSGASAREARSFAARFGAPARAGNGVSALVLPREALTMPLILGSPLTSPERRGLMAQLQGAAPMSSFADSIKALARSHLAGGQAEIATVARSAGVSVRTLQRRLGDEGTSFSALVAAARFDAAQDLLADPTLRLIDIATALGYEDAANFTRAFKGWAGVAPSAFRRGLAPAVGRLGA